MGVFYVVIGDFEATKSGEVGASAELFADIFGEGADVGTGTTVDAKGERGVIIVEDVDTIDFDFATRDVEIGTSSG